MKVVDRNLLREFSALGPCEFCGWNSQRHAHHIYSRGAGQVDIRENLVGLCWRCHRQNHDGHEPKRNQLLQVAAWREGTTPHAITAEVHRLRRLPKPIEAAPKKRRPAPKKLTRSSLRAMLSDCLGEIGETDLDQLTRRLAEKLGLRH